MKNMNGKVLTENKEILDASIKHYQEVFKKIPHTGDKASLDRCG